MRDSVRLSRFQQTHKAIAGPCRASDVVLVGSNHNVKFSPRREYLFVADPSFNERMAREVDPTTKLEVGERIKVDITALLAAGDQHITGTPIQFDLTVRAVVSDKRGAASRPEDAGGVCGDRRPCEGGGGGGDTAAVW